MTVRAILTVTASLMVTGTGWAGQTLPVITYALHQEFVPEVSPLRIKEAVKGLASNDYDKRESAHASILEMGEKAATQLRREWTTVNDAEARRRLSLILQKLDLDRMTTARIVTLVGEGMTAPQALRRICQQSGYRFRSEGLGDEHDKKRVYDFALSKASFWEAADKICNLSGLGLQVEDDGGIRAFQQDAFNPHVSYSGPFRFVANQIQSNRYLQLGGLSRQSLPAANPEGLGINLTVFSEPKATLVGVRGPWILKMLDEKGKAIPQPVADPSQSFYGSNGYKSYNQNLHLSFQRPAKEATTIKEVKAKATMVLLSEIKPDVVVPDLAKSKGKKVSGRSAMVEITEVDVANGSATVTATFTNPSGNPNDYQWANSLWQRFEVCDSGGEKYTVNISNTNYQSPQNIIVTFQAMPPDGVKCGPPSRFTIVEWVTRSVDVEFTLKDIPLP